MEFSKNDMKNLKGVAILLMLLLHLFARKEVNGLYISFPTIDGVPLIYYLALFGDACVPIYLFASGYGLFISLSNKQDSSLFKNFTRIFKLLLNYWIILILFVVVGIFMGSDNLPGSFNEFLLNFFTLSSSYNGAWWFVQTYIILVLLSPLLFKIVRNYNSVIVLLITGFIYFVSYIQRIKYVIDLGDNVLINTLVSDFVLVGTSLFAFYCWSNICKG